MTSYFLDCSELLCPLPVLKARKRLKSLEEGDILEIITTDEGALRDFQALCVADTSLILLDQKQNAQNTKHRIKKDHG